MKHLFFASILLTATVLTACKKAEKPVESSTPTSPSAAAVPAPTPAQTQSTSKQPEAASTTSPGSEKKNSFNLANVAVSTAQLGEFPYFKAPEGYKFFGEEQTKFDRQHFVIDGKLTPIAGETFTAGLQAKDGTGASYIPRELVSAYDELVKKVGGTKLENPVLETSEQQRIVDKGVFKNTGLFSIDANNLDTIHTYVIRTAADEIWIQMSVSRAESGKITIVRKANVERVAINLLNGQQLKSAVGASTQASPSTISPEKKTSFEIANVSVSTAPLGDFPYFKAPEGYKFYNEEKRKFDKQYFVIDKTLTPIEGETFKAGFNAKDGKGNSYIPVQVVYAYDDLIKKIGGTKLENPALDQSEVQRIGQKALYSDGGGYSLNANSLDTIHTYVVRTAADEIWIQLTVGRGESGTMAIVRKASLGRVGIELLDAQKMKSAIAATGRVAVNINFETDKATLLETANPAINEIVTLLKADSQLNLSIEGHTDDVGTATRNLELSTQRAQTVKAKLISLGIDAKRLSSTGFGSSKPLGANDSEANRAKNRRVELVKVN
jgi:OmpA-OmpF porin, OOP family